MRASVAAFALLLLALLPAPAAADEGIAVDLEVRYVDESQAILVETVTEGSQHFSPWKLPIPEGATVVEAHDARGFLTNSTTADGFVSVKTRGTGSSYVFAVVFSIAPERIGPYLHVLGQVSGNDGDPTSVRATLPAGWTLAGVRAQDGVTADAGGVYRTTGAFNVEFVALPEGFADPGPDYRAQGAGVYRAGFANLTASGGALDVTVVYDTDVYSDVVVPVPPGATPVSARTQTGPAAFTVEADGVHVPDAYPYKFGLAGRPIQVRFDLPPPTSFGGPFLNHTINMPAGKDDNLTLAVRLADGLEHVGSRTRASVGESGLDFTAREPFVVDVAFLPPTPAGQTRFAEGSTFVVQVPAALEAKARVVAANASALLPEVSAFAGGDRVERPFYVTYTADETLFTLFQGEQGFYTGGMNTITIRAADLDNVTTAEADFQAVSTLVHEATHGLIDRQIPDGYGNLSFLQEGLARLAEHHLEKRFPGEVVQCTPQMCTRVTVRPDPADVQARYKAGTTFPLTWTAATAGDDVGALYDLSGMIFRAYEERSDPLALGRALIALAVRGEGPDDAAEARAVVDALLAQSPGMTETSLLYPGRSVANLPADRFEACMGDLVRPRYPPPLDDPLPPRPADCGDLPLAATESADAGPPPEDADNFTLPTPPTSRPTLPVAATPTSSLPTPTGGTTEGPSPGGPDEPGVTQAPVPGPAVPLVAAVVVALAILLRRR